MIDLIFPDGSKRQFGDGVTGREVAASIAISLAKKAVLISWTASCWTWTARWPPAASLRF